MKTPLVSFVVFLAAMALMFLIGDSGPMWLMGPLFAIALGALLLGYGSIVVRFFRNFRLLCHWLFARWR